MAFQRSIRHSSRLRSQQVFGLLPSATVSVRYRAVRAEGLITKVSPLDRVSGEGVDLAEFPQSVPGEESGEASVGFVLSSHFCRFLSVPWSDALATKTRGEAYLRRTFLDAYGECAGEWEIVCADEGYGQPRVACAIDRPILDAICGHGMTRQPAFVRPYFSAAYNLFRAQMGAAKALFAAVEPGAVTVSRILNGSVVEIEVLTGDDHWQNPLAAWLARNALLDDDPGTVFVACPPAMLAEGEEEVAMSWKLLPWPEAVREAVAEHPALALPACAL